MSEHEPSPVERMENVWLGVFVVAGIVGGIFEVFIKNPLKERLRR